MFELSRRSLVGLGLALPALGALRMTQAAPVDSGQVPLNYNESPWGPSAAARQAMAEGIGACGRYPYKAQYRLVDLFASQHGLQADQVQVFCGSKLALQHAVMAFTQRGSLVLADPSYEAPVEAARARGTAVHAVALDADHAHDVDAMLAADPAPGMIYLCNPNNPTGTLTPRRSIERLLARSAANTTVVVDEAYIHFSDAPSCIDLVRDYPQLLVLQTFSKLYGMGTTAATPGGVRRRECGRCSYLAGRTRQFERCAVGAQPQGRQRAPARHHAGLAHRARLALHREPDQLLHDRPAHSRAAGDRAPGRARGAGRARVAKLAELDAGQRGQRKRHAAFSPGLCPGDAGLNAAVRPVPPPAH